MSKEKIKIWLERDSVCAGDDCDAPHALILVYDNPPTIREVVTSIIKKDYLAHIYQGRVSWVVTGKCPIAVLIQLGETQEPINDVDEFENKPLSFHIYSFLVDENAPYSEYIDEKLFIEYHTNYTPLTKSIFGK